MLHFSKFIVLSGLCGIMMVQRGYSQESDSDTLRVYELKQVVVTGTRLEENKLTVPSTVAVIGEETIRESHDQNVLSVLNGRIPNLFINERSLIGFGVGPRSGGGISIRGLSSSGDPANTRTLVLIDGQPQFMGLFGHPIHDAYFSSDIERVEVLRGPASILYGTNAMGGAVNIITRKQERDGFLLNGRAGYGSFNSQQYNVSSGYKNEGFEIFAAVNHASTDGHRDEGKSDFSTTGAFIKSSLKLNETFKIGIDGNISDSWFFDPGPVGQTFEDHRFDFMRGRVAVSLENTMGKAGGALKAFYTFGEHEFHDGFHSVDYNRGVTFYQNFKLFPGNTLTAGIDVKNYGGDAENTIGGAQLVDEDLTETDVYAVVQQAIDKLNLSAGVRLVNHSVFGSEAVPQFGFSYQINEGSSLKGSVGKAFRSPTVVNLYFVAANPDLEPERMWSYEIGYLQSLMENRLSFELTGFINRGDNLIQMTMPEPGVLLNQNTGDFEHKGIEFQASYAAAPGLNFSFNYGLLDMKDPLPYAPRHQFGLHSHFKSGAFRAVVGIKQVSGLLVGAVQAPVDTSLPRESYTLLDLNLSYQIIAPLSVFIKGENLLDQEYQIDKGYPLPGIAALGGLHFRLGN